MTYRYAKRTSQLKESFIREMVNLMVDPELISFAGGMPTPEFFPVEEMKKLSLKG
jgi:DNA-binding transcriptional MocR family regulator